jgi:uncharacterized peroxidase-related enzyme
MAHGAALRVLAKNPYVADQVAVDHRHADLTSRERALVDLAIKLTEEPAAVGDEDIDRLRAEGLSDSDIWDAGAIAAFFNMSNRMASLAAMRPNREFYSLGR